MIPMIQMISNDSKWFQMIPNDSKWFQMISNDSKWSQIFKPTFKDYIRDGLKLQNKIGTQLQNWELLYCQYKISSIKQNEI